jgi:hypothetical protein
MQRFPIQPVTDATVVEIIERLYNQRPHLERLTGGVNYPVYAFSFADGREERVIKLSGVDQWRPWALLDEIAAMRALRSAGIVEVPEIECCQEDLGWTTIPFFVTRRIRPGVQIEPDLGPNDPDAEQIWRQAGALRARFGQVDWQCTTRTLTPRQAAEQILRAIKSTMPYLDRHPVYAGVFNELLATVTEVAMAQGEAFGQGDAAEILTCDQQGLGMVDFSGFVGAHRRLREIGMINGRIRFRYGGDPRLPTWHEEGFFAGEHVTPEMRQELTLWELYALVMDVGWLTELGRQAEAESQLAFAQQRLTQMRPV